MMFRIHHQDPRTLFQALLESSAIHGAGKAAVEDIRSEEHTSELQSLMRISYAVFCLKQKTKKKIYNTHTTAATTATGSTSSTETPQYCPHKHKHHTTRI